MHADVALLNPVTFNLVEEDLTQLGLLFFFFIVTLFSPSLPTCIILLVGVVPLVAYRGDFYTVSVH